MNVIEYMYIDHADQSIDRSIAIGQLIDLGTAVITDNRLFRSTMPTQSTSVLITSIALTVRSENEHHRS